MRFPNQLRIKALGYLMVGLLVATALGCSQPATPTPTVAPKATPAKEAQPAATAARPAATSAATPAATSAAKPQAKEAAKAVKVKVGYTAIAGSQLPLWVTKEKGLFAKYGLEAELEYLASASTAAQAMLSGEVPLVQGAANSAVSANIAGGDLVMIAGTTNVLAFSLYGVPSIQRIEDLKGKTLGVAKFGSAMDFAARMVLKKFGMEPGKDVAIVELGDNAAAVAAMQAGAIQATVTGPPNTVVLRKLGMREVVNIPELAIPYLQTAITANKPFYTRNPDVVKRFMQAFLEGIAVSKNEKDYAIKILGQYTKSDDKEVLEDTYDYYTIKILPKVPYATVESVQTIIDEMVPTNPKAKDAKPESFIDNRVVKELDDSGFIKKLYGQ